MIFSVCLLRHGCVCGGWHVVCLLQTEGWLTQRSPGWLTSCAESPEKMIATADWPPSNSWKNLLLMAKVKWYVKLCIWGSAASTARVHLECVILFARTGVRPRARNVKGCVWSPNDLSWIFRCNMKETSLPFPLNARCISPGTLMFRGCLHINSFTQNHVLVPCFSCLFA